MVLKVVLNEKWQFLDTMEIICLAFTFMIVHLLRIFFFLSRAYL